MRHLTLDEESKNKTSLGSLRIQCAQVQITHKLIKTSRKIKEEILFRKYDQKEKKC